MLLHEILAQQDGSTTIGELFEVTRKPRGLDLSQQTQIPFVPMDAIPQSGAFSPRYDMKLSTESGTGTYFEKCDILVGKITPSFENGKQALVYDLPSEFGFATTEVIPLRPKATDRDRRLLFYYLLHPDIRSFITGRMEGATGRKRVPESVLLELPFPTFDRDEEQAISDCLSQVRSSIDIEDRLVQELALLKHSAMRELFSRGLRSEIQKDTEIGAIPESWELIEFGQARHRLQYGTSIRCSNEPSPHPVLRIPNIAPGRVDASSLKYAAVSEKEASRHRLEKGDIIFIRTNGVLDRLGCCAVFNGEPEGALFASYLIRAHPDRTKLNPYFAAYFYSSQVGTALVAGRATPAADGKYNLNTGIIDSLPLPLPPSLDEQGEIVSILDAIDSKLSLHKRKRVLLDEIFRALLHKLMTGEIRVADLDLSALQSHEEVAA
jgi:type I restriction enzyme S subunit